MYRILYFAILLAFTACNNNAADTADTAEVKTPVTQVKRPATTPTKRNIPAKSGPYKAKNDGWMVNLEKAYEQSKKSGKPIMANFTGSDWCGWCKRLDKSVFHQPGFDKWAEENVVLLELDFPRRFRVPPEVAQQNQSLRSQFGVRGYPTIWLFDANKTDAGQWDLKPLGKTGYTKTLAEFQKTMGGYISKRG